MSPLSLKKEEISIEKIKKMTKVKMADKSCETVQEEKISIEKTKKVSRVKMTDKSCETVIKKRLDKCCETSMKKFDKKVQASFPEEKGKISIAKNLFAFTIQLFT